MKQADQLVFAGLKKMLSFRAGAHTSVQYQIW